MKTILCITLLFCNVYLLAQNAETSKKENDNTEAVSYEVIENVPIFKGCDPQLSNQELKKCMSNGITSIVTKNFNFNLANNLGLPAGNKRIDVIFKINKEGEVTNIQARSVHPGLETEAIRVIKLIPKLDKPGLQRGQPVTVQYALPIIVQVDDSKNNNTLVKTYPIFRGCSENLSYEAQKVCSDQKIKDFIKMSFDYEMAERVFSTEKSTQFLVEFTINKQGKAENINAKANHRAVAIDVIRVVKRMPKFKKPGTVNGKAISTQFSMLMTLYFP
jgi:hypothetical protein